MTATPGGPASLVPQLLELLACELDFRVPTDPHVTSEMKRIADEYTTDAHAAAAAFILDVASSIAVRDHGVSATVAYLDSVIEAFQRLACHGDDFACERRALLAWRDCVDDADSDLATRAALYSPGDSSDYVAGLHAALDNAVWMLAHFADPNDPHHDPPYDAYDALRAGVDATREHG